MADAKAKLGTLADFAEHHGDRFIRVVSINTGGDGTLRVRDLLDADARAAVRAFGAKASALYESTAAQPYL